MATHIRRREIIAALGGAAAAWSLAARAQQPAMPVIGYLSARSPADTVHRVDAFRRGLKETGFIEGQNVGIEYRWAFGEQNQLPRLVAELVQIPVALLVTTGGESAALAAKAAPHPFLLRSLLAAIQLSSAICRCASLSSSSWSST